MVPRDWPRIDSPGSPVPVLLSPRTIDEFRFAWQTPLTSNYFISTRADALRHHSCPDRSSPPTRGGARRRKRRVCAVHYLLWRLPSGYARRIRGGTPPPVSNQLDREGC